jgi:hypothetical protein
MSIPESELALHKALQRIHMVITRGLEVTHHSSLALAEKFTPQGRLDADTQVGFYRYAHCLVTVLETHHKAEEEVTFPYFKERLPGLRLAPLIEQHQQMQPHIHALKASIVELASETPPTAVLEQLSQACNNVRILWTMHAPAEENYFAAHSATALQLTAEEQRTITRRTVEYSQQYSRPPEWVLAFVLYNLSPAERAEMSQSMPAHLTKMMVPIIWKNEWAPMKPYLLD